MGGTCVKTEKVLFYIAVTALSLRATGTHHIRHIFLEVVWKEKNQEPVIKHSISLTEGQNLQYESRCIAMEPNDLVDYRIRF